VIKLLWLFTECIITSEEFFRCLEHVMSDKDKSVQGFLHESITSRENSRRKQTPYFKPLIDIDFSKSLRYTHSYVKMPFSYPNYCSSATTLSRDVLNDKVISVPQGSEHQSFLILRKN